MKKSEEKSVKLKKHCLVQPVQSQMDWPTGGMKFMSDSHQKDVFMPYGVYDQLYWSFYWDSSIVVCFVLTNREFTTTNVGEWLKGCVGALKKWNLEMHGNRK